MNKQEILPIFNKQLSKFLNELIETFPENEEVIKEHLPFENMNDEKYINQFYKTYKDLGADIKNNNLDILNNELVENVNIHNLITKKDVNDNIKKSIWNYISCFYLYSILYNSDNNVSQIMETMNKNNLLNDIVTNINEQQDNDGSEIDLDKLFKNNKILSGELGNLTKDIMNDLDVKSLITEMDPMSLMSSLMNPNSVSNEDNPIHNLINNISGKIQTKLESGSINEQKLVQEAQNISNEMKNPINKDSESHSNSPDQAPDLGNMLSSLLGGNGEGPDISKMMSSLMGNKPGEEGSPDLGNMMSSLMGGNTDSNTDSSTPDLGNMMTTMMPMVQSLMQGMGGQTNQPKDLSTHNQKRISRDQRARERLRKKLQNRTNSNLDSSQ